MGCVTGGGEDAPAPNQQFHVIPLAESTPAIGSLWLANMPSRMFVELCGANPTLLAGWVINQQLMGIGMQIGWLNWDADTYMGHGHMLLQGRLHARLNELPQRNKHNNSSPAPETDFVQLASFGWACESGFCCNLHNNDKGAVRGVAEG